MNSELCRQAIEKIGNPNVLVNVLSRRVRQLTTGTGASSRPLLLETAGMSASDIALTEVVEGKLTYEFLADNPLLTPLDGSKA